MIRAFIGLPLPQDVVQALQSVQGSLTVGRCVAAENLHLTLAFLDEQPEAALAALHEELTAIRLPVPRLRISGLDVFGGDKARLVYAAVAADPDLAGLRTRVRGAVRTAGIHLPRERFRPHVTLARLRQRKAPGEIERLHGFLARAGAFSLPEFTVREFVLYQSTLTPEGAIYDALASYPLG